MAHLQLWGQCHGGTNHRERIGERSFTSQRRHSRRRKVQCLVERMHVFCNGEKVSMQATEDFVSIWKLENFMKRIFR